MNDYCNHQLLIANTMKYSPWTSHKQMLVPKILLFICFYIYTSDITAFSPVNTSSNNPIQPRPLNFHPFGDNSQNSTTAFGDCGAFAEDWVHNLSLIHI